MYDLFQSPNQIKSAGYSDGQWPRLKAGLLNQVKRISDHYLEHPVFIPNQHLLVRFINSFNVPHSYPLERYCDLVGDIAYDISRRLGMTSMLAPGKTHRNVLYHTDCQETLIVHTAHDESLHAENFNQWLTLRPIQVLQHPYTDLNCRVPGIHYTNHTAMGTAVIAINAVTLLAQYRYWVKTRLRENATVDAAQFLSQVVLPNALYSHLDQALVNRTIALYRQTEVLPHQRVHSLYQVNYDREIDEVLYRQLAFWIERPSLHYLDYLRQWPQASVRSLLKHLRNPEGDYSRNLQWALILAKLPITGFLLQIQAESGSQNRTELQSLVRLHRRWIGNANYMRQYLDATVLRHYESECNTHVLPYL